MAHILKWCKGNNTTFLSSYGIENDLQNETTMKFLKARNSHLHSTSASTWYFLSKESHLNVLKFKQEKLWRNQALVEQYLENTIRCECRLLEVVIFMSKFSQFISKSQFVFMTVFNLDRQRYERTNKTFRFLIYNIIISTDGVQSMNNPELLM